MSANRTRLAAVDDFDGDGSRVLAEVRGREVAVFRHDGEFHAVANYCIHQAGPLCEGALTGHTTTDDDGWDWSFDAERKYVSCPWHGWTFDIETGTSVKDDRYRVPTYEVEVEDGVVYLVH